MILSFISFDCSTVSEDLQSSSECFVLFAVKDWDLMSRDDFIGEAFLSFPKINRSSGRQSNNEPEQLLLPLTLPNLGEDLFLLT